MAFEIRRELWRIVETRGGAVFRTAFEREVWIADGAIAPPGYILVSPNDGRPTIRERD